LTFGELDFIIFFPSNSGIFNWAMQEFAKRSLIKTPQTSKRIGARKRLEKYLRAGKY